ncbi:hypothetical protein MMC29_001723 [Sticta canariensis]|nr:hypothetical protein [Sticta canariensis]
MPDLSPNPPPSSSSNTAPSIDSPTPTPSPFPTRTLAISLFVACPILILAPPRKVDFYTFSLCTAWVVSAQKLYVIESHKLPTWVTRRRPIVAAANEERVDEKSQPFVEGKSKPGEREERGGIVGMARRLWMGKEQAGWQERRLKEHREKLEEGESYAGLIGETIMEAFGAAREKEEDTRVDENGGKDEKEG